MHSLNVSEIHLCQRCPRLLAYHLSGHKQVWRIGLSGTQTLPGKFFHDKIVSPFHKKLASTRSHLFKALKRIHCSDNKQFARAFLEIAENHFFMAMLKKHSHQLEAQQIIHIGKAFEMWCHHLSDFLFPIISQQQEAIHLEDIFQLPEQAISQTYQSKTGQQLTISGRYDAVLFDIIKKVIVILECKGRELSRSDEDLAQVALYAWLIQQKTGVTPKAIIIYLEGEQNYFEVSSKMMTEIFQNFSNLFDTIIDIDDRIQKKLPLYLPRSADHQLCDACCFNTQCDNDYGESSQLTEKILKKINTPQNSIPLTNDLPKKNIPKEVMTGMETILDLFKKLHLPVFDRGFIYGPRFIRYKLEPDFSKNVTVAKIINRSQDLQVALKLNDIPLMRSQAGYISIDIPRKVRMPLTLGELMKKGKPTKPNSSVSFPIGMGIDGSIIWIDLNDPSTTSILVGGTSGSGKSILLRAILGALANSTTPQHLTFTLIDPKQVSFMDLQQLPHIDSDIITENETAICQLNELVQEMEDRYQEFKDIQVMDIVEYHQKGYQKPHHLVIIDEYADLIIDKEIKKDLELAIQRLGQKGRAAGIHLILATQRPDAKVVTPLIKANLQLKIALKVTTASNSNIILDQSGAECLIGKGDMLIGGSIPIARLQGAIASKTDIKRIIQKK